MRLFDDIHLTRRRDDDAVPPDTYVYNVIAKYDLPSGADSPARRAGEELCQPIRDWARKYLIGIHHSGSYAKGTRIKGSADLDLVISLGPRTPGTLEKVYDNLFAALKAKGYQPRRENASVRITHEGLNIDLIPAKLQWGSSNNHALFETAHSKELITNFDIHTKYVQDAGRADEIKATKIWRNLRNLRFPSFYLELVIIEALKGRASAQPAVNLLRVFDSLRDDFVGTRFRDPANEDNFVSDNLSEHEQLRIADAAAVTLREKDWSRIIW